MYIQTDTILIFLVSPFI